MIPYILQRLPFLRRDTGRRLASYDNAGNRTTGSGIANDFRQLAKEADAGDTGGDDGLRGEE